jgi:hypothetical protein
MDPYLEAHWRDVHARLIIYASDALQSVLPGSLRARVEERVVLQGPQGFFDHPRFPDLRVVEYWSKSEAAAGQAGRAVGVDEPLVLDVHESITETFIEIIDAGTGNQVITVIEFLSPGNKVPGTTRDQYLRKQSELCASTTNLVEVDLIRTGVHTLAFHGELLTWKGRTPYFGCVRRAATPLKAEVYLIPISRRLPTLKIPLRPDDADVPLDLQALIEQCYRNGGYDATIDYAQPPEPPLGVWESWVENRLQEMGLRKKPTRRNGKGKPKKKK